MRALYVHRLDAAERAAVEKAKRCSSAVSHRRARIVALSEAERRVVQIAETVGMRMHRVYGE